MTKTAKGRQSRGGEGGLSAKKSGHSFTSALSALDRKGMTQAAVKLSMTGGGFIDTKFYAYSKRKGSGTVEKPVALYANSTILKASSKYFEGLFVGGYRENKLSPLDAPFPADYNTSTEEYDYLSDSDLEDEEEEEGRVEFIQASEGAEQSLAANSEEAATSAIAEQLEDLAIVDGPQGATGLQGRVVVVPDIAYRTLRALIFYLYTDEVSFAPLRSQKVQRPNEPGINKAPLCSPKSMYRIADKYGLDKLKDLAAADIKSKLSSTNILPELFSTITATHDNISTVQVAYACDKTVYATVAAGIGLWITRVASGELAHCESILTALFKKTAETQTPTPAAPAVGTRTNCNCGRTFSSAQLYKYCSYCGHTTV